MRSGALVAGDNVTASLAGPFGNAASAIVLGDGSTGAGDAPALLIGGTYSMGRAVNVGSVANAAAYNATLGSTNTTGTATFTGAITLNTAAANYTVTLQAAAGGTNDFTARGRPTTRPSPSARPATRAP